MSLLLLLTGAGGSDTPEPTIQVLPADDLRISKPLMWVPDLTQRLIRLLHEKHDWSQVSPHALEEIVAELFSGFGYLVELTKHTRDGGRDVVAIKNSTIKDDKYLIECKRWADKVDVSVVRELLGVGTVEPNSGLILVSTSGFTSDAMLLARRDSVRWTLSLKDKDDLEGWIRGYAELKGWRGGR